MAKKMGRPRKPTATLKFEGTFRSDRRNNDEPTPEVLIPKMPSFLKGEAAKEWKRVTPLLAARKCVTKWDRSMLAAYCYEWGRYTDICLQQVKFPLTAPNATQRTKALKNFQEIATQFGLSPSSRTNLSMGKADTNNPFEALMNRKKA